MGKGETRVRTTLRFARVIGTACVAGLIGLALPVSATAQGEKNPLVRKALVELREAKKQLQESAHDFGGFRLEALRNTDVSIFLVEKALQFDKGVKGKKKKSPVFSLEQPVAAPFAQGEKHPHMHRALVLLREAKRNLQKATRDFGGFRAEAVRTIEVSIFLIEKGLHFDRK
jgi:hypothetical protein